MREHLAAFPDLELTTSSYEAAADWSNHCMAQGVQAAHTDFRIAAAAIDRGHAVFSADRDFEILARVIPVRMYDLR